MGFIVGNIRKYFIEEDVVWCIHCCETIAKSSLGFTQTVVDEKYAKHVCSRTPGPLAIDWRLAWMNS